ncbi:hypothetical protein SLEP1_g21890 [Rubroshorea leprosula]|uniref:Uncharacterized protein n=1 Tax=Rubroshorea leprosula TaxID=152421 RepID=A0AAV5JAK1_9ROSI|nr:hypothetical protein SLEP1_g21890 [Rubroshorea leprosula]
MGFYRHGCHSSCMWVFVMLSVDNWLKYEHDALSMLVGLKVSVLLVQLPLLVWMFLCVYQHSSLLAPLLGCVAL